ncbi:MAG: GNAT family N-acetyltransferase [Lewinellaceae bacterium]|nr:GNAT family N-acetyltransferase [Saprospiraceae bacterium]MCB9330696.1 GNAT family N-acetyltransferase [Lewinellaceae bacterium]
MEFETLQTDRLFLKKITPEVLSHLFQNYKDEEIMTVLGLSNYDEFIKERDKSRGGYTTYDRTILSFLLVLKSTNETIGRCGFHNWYAQHHRAEIGYALAKEEFKRKGYMREAVHAVLKYGFEVMHLNRVEAYIGPGNIASLRIVAKYGFTQEGVLRQHYAVGGEFQDSIIFSLLKNEFAGKE